MSLPPHALEIVRRYRTCELTTFSKRGVPVTLPEALGAMEGPANLLCHFHDDKLWSLRSIQISGRIEARDGGWRFATEKFDPPSTIAMIRGMQSSMKAYLARRNLPVPVVDYDAVKRMQANAKRIQNP